MRFVPLAAGAFALLAAFPVFGRRTDGFNPMHCNARNRSGTYRKYRSWWDAILGRTVATERERGRQAAISFLDTYPTKKTMWLRWHCSLSSHHNTRTRRAYELAFQQELRPYILAAAQKKNIHYA